MTAQPKPIHWLMIGLLGLIWGGTFLVIELALRGISPFWLAASRIGFACLLTTTIWRFMGGRLFAERPTRADMARLGAASALSTAIPFMLLSWGQQFVTSGFAGVSMAVVPLFILPLAYFFLPDEQLGWRKLTGFGLGFLGVLVLLGNRAFDSTGAGAETAGRLACLGAAACYATSSVLMRRLPAINPVGLSAVSLLIGACIVIPLAWGAEGPPPLPDAATLGYLALLGLVPTAGANLLRVMVIRSAGPTFMGLTNYQVPIWSVLLGAWVLAEPLPPTLLAAMALILLGVGLSQWRALKALFIRV